MYRRDAFHRFKDHDQAGGSCSGPEKSGGLRSGAAPRGGISRSAPRSGPNRRRASVTRVSPNGASRRATAARSSSRVSSSSDRRWAAALALSRACNASSTCLINTLAGHQSPQQVAASICWPYPSGRTIGVDTRQGGPEAVRQTTHPRSSRPPCGRSCCAARIQSATKSRRGRAARSPT
jgi:hypothetical protein